MRVGELRADELAATKPGEGNTPPRPVEAIKEQQGLPADQAPELSVVGDQLPKTTIARRVAFAMLLSLGVGILGWSAGFFVDRSRARSFR